MDLEFLARNLNEAQKIGEGVFRETFVVAPGVCAKRLKKICKRKIGGRLVSLPSKPFVALAYGISDFNDFDYQAYLSLSRKIPDVLRDSFAEIYGVSGGVLFQKLITNYDGNISSTLANHGKVNDEGFWIRVLDIKNFLFSERIRFFNLNPKNLLVKYVSPHDALPVLADYKRVEPKATLLQAHLLRTDYADQRMSRQFERLNEFCPATI